MISGNRYPWMNSRKKEKNDWLNPHSKGSQHVTSSSHPSVIAQGHKLHPWEVLESPREPKFEGYPRNCFHSVMGKQTKSFTGCWTCRTRRLKCDETRPSCRQCDTKGLECEGYSTKLQWLRPLYTNGKGKYERRRIPQSGVQRRRLLPGEHGLSSLHL